MRIQTVHHVSVPVAVGNLDNAKDFYENVLGLRKKEIEPRPEFEFDGAWYQAGDREIHLIVDENKTSTFRPNENVDSRDVHFALRIDDYEAARLHLREKGYYPEAPEKLKRTRESKDNLTPWQQIYVMDCDRNVIELNAVRPKSGQ
jgi:glyoxylase I family protein